MKFKHTTRNYLLFPFIIIVNPIIAVINYFLKYLSDKVDNLFDLLPKFDVDYLEHNRKVKKEIMDKYFSRTIKK